MSKPTPQTFEEALDDLRRRTEDGMRYHETKVEKVREAHQRALAELRDYQERGSDATLSL